MAEKKGRDGKVSVSTWMDAATVKVFDARIKKMEVELQSKYPGARLTRHAVLQTIIVEWLEAQK